VSIILAARSGKPNSERKPLENKAIGAKVHRSKRTTQHKRYSFFAAIIGELT
jgi:hypothetical protein